MNGDPGRWPTAVYCRLSREDGDRPESDSIGNQRTLLEEYAARHPDLQICGYYIDDGWTGTNFERPDFQRMVEDIEKGHIRCVLVKDLSRFGRDYIDAGRYLERWFPAHDARFISVNDNIDSRSGACDIMLAIRNVFNAQYAKDISVKVKSAFKAKQRRGEFVGAFASYGYRKDPQDHNRLVVDSAAAAVVERVFSLFEDGMGKVRIAKELNEEKIPCPSAYKHLMGEKYRNCNRLDSTAYWTYATVHRILQNEMYIGNMEQGRSTRAAMHGPAQQTDRSEWIVVPGTHEAIISRAQWDRVQALLNRNARTPEFRQNVSPFAGYLKCGDCGRSMAKTNREGRSFYTCGSYKRYGPSVCSRHYIPLDVLEQAVLDDLNRIIAGVADLRALAEKSAAETEKTDRSRGETERLRSALERVRRLRQGAYEDYREQLISKADFLRYRRDYDRQEETLQRQLARLSQQPEKADPPGMPWVRELLDTGRLCRLDRITVAETIGEIRVFEGNEIEITYLFSDALRGLLEREDT